MAKVNAALREELRDFVKKHHTPRRIYRWAKEHPSSLTHGWLKAKGAFDPERAMLKYGESLVTDLIVKVKVSLVLPGGKRARVREFVSLASDRRNGGGYRNVAEVLKDSDLRADLVRTFQIEAERFAARFEAIKDLAEVKPVYMAIQSVLPVRGEEKKSARASA